VLASRHHPHTLRGIFLMMAAVSTFACLDTISKWLTQHYPVPVIVWVRYVFQMGLLLVLLAPRMGWRLVKTAHPGIQVVRGLVLVAAGMVFVAAISYMPLAEVVSINFMGPIFIAVASGILLRERIGAKAWVALALGFTGVLLIVRPGTAIFQWAALLPLGSALGMTVYQMLTRRVAGRDHALTSLFYPTLVGAVAVPVAFPHAMQFPTVAWHWSLFVAVGALGGFGHWLLIKAHELATAAVLAPFMYVQLVVVLFLGWAVFSQLPDGIAVLGMLVITGSGLLLVFRRSR
jgi:drug/metabolite transporter (DMT)-like permease